MYVKSLIIVVVIIHKTQSVYHIKSYQISPLLILVIHVSLYVQASLLGLTHSRNLWKGVRHSLYCEWIKFSINLSSLNCFISFSNNIFQLGSSRCHPEVKLYYYYYFIIIIILFSFWMMILDHLIFIYMYYFMDTIYIYIQMRCFHHGFR